MPTTVEEIFAKILDKEPDGKIKWCDILKHDIPKQKGIYIIALDKPKCSPDFCENIIEEWISLAKNILIDGKSATVPAIMDRLGAFWYPDETILYIGQTSGGNQTLKKRLRQFYKHKLSESRPHRGGHWLKTLSNLNDLNVYWGIVEGEEPYEIELKMIEYFSDRVSEDSRESLFDKDMPIPFANLEVRNKRKKHGIKNQTVKILQRSRYSSVSKRFM